MKTATSEALQAALQEIRDFSNKCEVEEYTDVGEVWDVFNAVECYIRGAILAEDAA